VEKLAGDLAVALFYAWNFNGKFPNEDVPFAPLSSNVAKAEEYPIPFWLVDGRPTSSHWGRLCHHNMPE